MNDQEPVVTPPTENAPVESTLVVADSRAPRGRGGRGGDRGGKGGGDRGGQRRGGRRTEKPRSEFDQKIIQLRRVARVVQELLTPALTDSERDSSDLRNSSNPDR